MAASPLAAASANAHMASAAMAAPPPLFADGSLAAAFANAHIASATVAAPPVAAAPPLFADGSFSRGCCYSQDRSFLSQEMKKTLH
jgi:hypothetical protein